MPWSAIIFVRRDADIDICERRSRSSRARERSDCSFDLRNEAADFRNDRDEPMLASSHVAMLRSTTAAARRSSSAAASAAAGASIAGAFGGAPTRHPRLTELGRASVSMP